MVGAKALMTALKNWTQEPNSKFDAISSGSNVPKLLKDMAKEVGTAENKLNGKVKAEKETKKGKQGPAKVTKTVVVAAAAVEENVTPVRGGGASQQGINSKVNLPIKTKGKAKGKITDGLKAKAATQKAKIVKEEKPAPALPPVKPLHKESVYYFNDSEDGGLVVDENPPPQPRRSYERAVAIHATPALPPISKFSINASMGNFAGGGRLQQARLEPRDL
ncbi:hypothetical protein HPB49_005871 [Dermacentor silvarum]|uniref:Uncharacterized protein n=1 Tax=Dermacentor silvarum TaxID=543639 RepID=A0ACB8DVN0_DERSI|nr:hypothetical protein HPB49_005871 [Dermacentor silvarum]